MLDTLRRYQRESEKRRPTCTVR